MHNNTITACSSPSLAVRGAPETHCSASSPGLSVQGDLGRTVGRSGADTTQNGAQMPAWSKRIPART